MDVKKQLEILPPEPGVYLFKGMRGQVLYVGKAKSLRHRVRSYFLPGTQLDEFKTEMVGKIKDLDFIKTDTEHEALVLEASLIQKHYPPYNVILTDDKYYLFVKITKDKPSRVFLTRRAKNDGARYFGPYTSARAVRHTLNFLKRIFPYHDEKKKISNWILPHPLFHLVNNNLDTKTYQENIKHIINFLKGDRKEIVDTLHQGMRTAATKNKFEQAAIFRDQLQAIENLNTNQKVLLSPRENMDLISIAQRHNFSAINVFSVRRGKLINKNTCILRHRDSTPTNQILRQFILQYYQLAKDIPGKIFIPETIDDQATIGQWLNSENPPKFQIPKRGKKLALLKMGQVNADLSIKEKELELLSQNERERALNELAQALNFKKLQRIETYDISNIQGKLSTGSMVVFEDGQANPKQYRKFKIKTIKSPNDFAMLQEVLTRRFNQNHNNWPTPDLIIIDGGKGQLSASVRALRDIGVSIPTIALAKREEEIFLPGQRESLRLKYDSNALHLIQRMRDEAHRFTLNYHKLLRSKEQKRSILDEVPNIGPKTKKKLINHFGSLKAIRSADENKLSEVIGAAKAKNLTDFL